VAIEPNRRTIWYRWGEVEQTYFKWCAIAIKSTSIEDMKEVAIQKNFVIIKML